MIRAAADEIVAWMVGRKVRKAEASDAWAALSYGRDGLILLSWDGDFYGACSATPEEVRELAAAGGVTPPILNALKSHLVGAEISGCAAVNRDRLLRIEFTRAIGAGRRQTRALLLEASGRYSNLILLDEDDIVIEAAKHIHPDENRYRSILPGLIYTPPPPLSGVPLEAFDFSNAPGGIDEIAGVGRPLLAAVKKSCRAELLRADLLFSDASIFQTLGSYVTLFPALLVDAEAIGTRSALAAARRTVVEPLLDRRRETYKKKIAAILDREARTLDRRITEYRTLEGDTDGAEALKRLGSLILANAHAIAPHAEEATLSEWTEAGEERRVVRLDPQKTPAQNAERYFAKYKKKKAAAQVAAERLPPLCAKREEIEEQRALLGLPTDAFVLAATLDELLEDAGHAGKSGKNAKNVKNIKKSAKDQAVPPHRRYEIAGESADIFCGLSAKGNRYVTFRLARPEDIWLHVQGVPGSHVILRLGAKPDAERLAGAVELAASCAVYHSKARESGRMRVDYVERKHVRAIGGTVSGVTYDGFSSVVTDSSRWENFLINLASLAENSADPPAENS